MKGWILPIVAVVPFSVLNGYLFGPLSWEYCALIASVAWMLAISEMARVKGGEQ